MDDRRNSKGVKLQTPQGVKIPRVIGISGKFGSGKDTVANYLAELFRKKDLKVELVCFATALKQIASAMMGIPIEDCYTPEGKSKVIPELGYSVGTLLQKVGAMARKDIHPDVWLMPVLRRASADPSTIFIILDCRHKNEANGIQDAGGFLIRLERESELIPEECKAGRDPNHLSETDLDDYPAFDVVIHNNGTRDELFSKVLASIQ